MNADAANPHADLLVDALIAFMAEFERKYG